MKKILSLILLSLFLTACEPTIFGMNEKQFNQLTPQQKQQVIDSYNRQQEIEAQNKPIEDLVGALNNAVDKHAFDSPK